MALYLRPKSYLSAYFLHKDMLIEFSVSNYRSFRERQTFSMVAAPRLAKKGNVVKPEVKGEKLPSLLKVAAIYGPNASGKSNLIKAFNIVSALATHDSSQALPVAPFRFDPALASKPSYFEFHFIAENQRYEFHLAVTSERIIEERLIAYPLGKETLLFSRIYTSQGEQYQFGSELEGGEIVHKAWQDLTSTRQLFIAQAATNSSEKLTQLKIPFQYLSTGVRVVSRELDRLSSVALALAQDLPDLNFESYVSSLLHELDVPVSSIQIEKVGDKSEGLGALIKAKDAEGKIDVKKVQSSVLNTKTTLTHQTALGEAKFDLADESDGTVNLIGFALPWMLMNGYSEKLKTLIVDELDSSLHPKIVARLIEKILSYEKSSQLIFSTHDTHLMETKLLRRDQLWITERDMNGATKLRSIHDFEGRESEDVEKRYYEGKYRGLPSLY